MSVGNVIHEVDRAKPAVDGLRFHDQSRFRSPEVARAFTSIRAVLQSPQSEVLEPDEVALDTAISEPELVRGLD